MTTPSPGASDGKQDAFVIFDDVEVPKDRVFIDANLAAYNAVMRTTWSPNIMQQTMIRAQTKLEFAWGVANRMLKCINGKQPAAQEMLGEIWSFSEFARSAIYASEMQAKEYPGAVWFPDVRPLHALRATLPYWFPRVNEIIRLLGSHNVFATPTLAQMRDPELKPLIDRYLRGAGDVSAEERVRVFRLGWDFVGSGLASRNEQYELFYLASCARNRQIHEAFFDPSRANRLVDQFLTIDTNNDSKKGASCPEGRVNVAGVEVSTDHYIDGHAGSPRTSGSSMTAHRSMARPSRRVSAGGSSEAEMAVDAARRAFPAWAALGPGGRAPILRQFSPRASLRAWVTWPPSKLSTTARCSRATPIGSCPARRRTSPTSPSTR